MQTIKTVELAANQTCRVNFAYLAITDGYIFIKECPVRTLLIANYGLLDCDFRYKKQQFPQKTSVGVQVLRR